MAFEHKIYYSINKPIGTGFHLHYQSHRLDECYQLTKNSWLFEVDNPIEAACHEGKDIVLKAVKWPHPLTK